MPRTSWLDIKPGKNYKIHGPDEFAEVLKSPSPEKEFELYSESHFRRK